MSCIIFRKKSPLCAGNKGIDLQKLHVSDTLSQTVNALIYCIQLINTEKTEWIDINTSRLTALLWSCLPFFLLSQITLDLKGQSKTHGIFNYIV